VIADAWAILERNFCAASAVPVSTAPHESLSKKRPIVDVKVVYDGLRDGPGDCRKGRAIAGIRAER